MFSKIQGALVRPYILTSSQLLYSCEVYELFETNYSRHATKLHVSVIAQPIFNLKHNT